MYGAEHRSITCGNGGAALKHKVSPMSPDPPDESVLKALLDVAKAELDMEFKISERFDSKARTFFGFAAGLFGVTQAFVLRSNFDNLSMARDHALKWTILSAAVLFAVAIVGVIRSTLQSADRNFDNKRIFAMARSSNTKLEDLVQEYAVLLGERRAANKLRLSKLHWAQISCSMSLGATAGEFILAAIYFT